MRHKSVSPKSCLAACPFESDFDIEELYQSKRLNVRVLYHFAEIMTLIRAARLTT
jgi:hypothetical protein